MLIYNQELIPVDYFEIEKKNRQHFKQARKVVVKAGSNVVTTDSDLDVEVMNCISKELSDLAKGGFTQGDPVNVVYVSSGAEKAAMHSYGMTEKVQEMATRRHLCGVGQTLLMEKYHELFGNWGQRVGMAWPTWTDVDNKLRETLEIGWKPEMGNTIYVLNYNDPLDDRELRAENKGGGNDDLAARVASLVNADLLIILTDTDGLYNQNPKVNPNSELITRVVSIDQGLLEMTGDGNGFGESKGGMRYKIHTRDHYDGDIVIANGRVTKGRYNIIHDIFSGELVGTYIQK
ncbi:MAG: hypothetical protein ACMXYG_06605 [Candidatus Woesearchaeota archaeon]